MSKTRRTFLNSISSMLLTILNGLLNLLITRKMIEIYGSDFNGLNATASQLISFILVLEGGFGLAANVALFKPLSENNIHRINSIVSAVRVKFFQIGLMFFLVGVAVSVIFSLLIKSELPYYIRLFTFIFLVLSTSHNLYYATRYKVLIQSDQREYIINFVGILTQFLTFIAMSIAIIYHAPMLVLRFVVMVVAILNSLLIAYKCKQDYPNIQYTQEPDFKSIKGTTDILFQKITGMVYFSLPIVAISTFESTAVASVYAVYNTVLTLIRSLENSVINAPRMSLGRLVVEEGTGSEKLRHIFDLYELITFITINCLLSVTFVMIMPFINIYTKNFNDLSYYNWEIAALLIFTCFIECIHIPSGNLINMAGYFKEGKKIQLFAGSVLLLSIFIGGLLLGLYGILLSVFITAILLSSLEIGFIRIKIFNNKWEMFWKNFLISTFISVILVIIEINIVAEITTFWDFFTISSILLMINFIFIFVSNYFLNKSQTTDLINHVLKMF